MSSEAKITTPPHLQEVITKAANLDSRRLQDSDDDDTLEVQQQPDLTKSLKQQQKEFEAQQLRDRHYWQMRYLRETHKLRRKYAKKLFHLICIWLATVGVLVVAKGFCGAFHLTDTVLITFMTSTTVSVLGLFIIAAKWMFNANGKVFGDEGRSRHQPQKKKNKKKTK